MHLTPNFMRARWRTKRKAKEEARKKEMDKWLGQPPFENYPTDEFFSPALARFLVIREGYQGVRLRFGKVGEVIAQDKKGNPIRDWPYGGDVDDGIRFMLGLKGLWSSMAVVYTGIRTDNLSVKNIVTADGIDLPEVTAKADWRVYDAVRAMTAGRDFVKTTMESLESRVREAVSPETIIQFASLPNERLNLAYDQTPRGNIYAFDNLKDIGVKVENLKIQRKNLPDTIETQLAEAAIAEARARGRVAEARASAESAIQDAMAGRVYNASKGARESAYLRAASRQEGRVSYDVGTGKIADAVSEGLGKIAESVGNIFGKKS